MSMPCRGCGQPIEFVKTANGKRIAKPLCVVVTPGGPLKVVLADGRVVSAREAVEGDGAIGTTDTVEARTSHFANCSKADSFRKGRA